MKLQRLLFKVGILNNINVHKEVSNNHDKYAPYWAVTLLVLACAGISTIWLDFGDFWKGYVLDMSGPAWNYILFRGLNTAKADNAWTRFFTPVRTFIIFVFTCFGIELLQFFKVYDATFDPCDFVAYVLLLIPVSLIDWSLSRSTSKRVS